MSFLLSSSGAISAVGLAVVYYLFLRKKKTIIGTWETKRPRQLTMISDVQKAKQAAADVAAKAKEWKDVSYAEKLELLLAVRENLKVLAPEFARLEVEFRGLEEDERYAGFGAIMGPGMTGLMLNKVIDVYQSLVSTGRMPPPVSSRQVGAQTVVQVSPSNLMEKVLQGGGTAELWLEPGAPVSQRLPNDGAPGCSLILGAGNYESPNDVLTKMFIECKTAVYKSNPVNAHAMDRVAPRLFEPLVSRGYLALATGGIEMGAALLEAPAFAEAMMTGGCSTYDAIVWGPPAEREANKAAGRKCFSKPFDAELGAVSPWMVVPGSFNAKEIRHSAVSLVGAKMMNAGHICASPQIIVIDRQWPQAEQFLQAVREVAQQMAPLPTYYRGTDERLAQLRERIPETVVLSGGLHLIEDLDACSDAEYFFQTEMFAPAMAIKYVDGRNDPAAFMDLALHVANEQCFGSLSCSLVIHPATQKKHDEAFRAFVANLRWGTVAVNDWAGQTPGHMELRWGAFAGAHSVEDIQSGIGEVANCYAYERVQKTVTYAPWLNPNTVKPWNAKSSKIFQRVSTFCVSQAWTDLFKVASAQFLGL